MYLLDTDVIINHAHQHEEISAKVQDSPTAISSITLAEILYGIEKYGGNSSEFFLFLEKLKIEIFPVNEEIVQSFATIKVELEKVGKRLDDFDILIAATAITHNLTLVTRNKKHFERIKGLKLY